MLNTKQKFTYIVCGILMSLPLLIDQLWILAWFAYIPVIYNELQLRHSYDYMQSAWKRAIYFFFSYEFTAFIWLPTIYPLNFAGCSNIESILLIALGLFGIPMIQSVVLSLQFIFTSLILKNKKNVTIAPIVFSAAWVIFEWMQTLTWAGLPWTKLAVGQTAFLPTIQSASVLGPYFISFIIILIASLIAMFAINKQDKVIKRCIPLILSAIIFFGNIGFGCIRINLDSNTEYQNSISVASIQGNISTQEKWNDDPTGALTIHKKLTLEAAKKQDVDLVVFAETAFPFALTEDDSVSKYLIQMAKDAEADMLVGCLYRDKNESLYNSIRMINQDGNFEDQIYSKRRPMPFGEYVPMEDVLVSTCPPLAKLNMGQSITPGDEATVFNINGMNIGTIICFDSLYENLALSTVNNNAEILLISTNDCWFKDSAAVDIHNRHAILRAVENNRYVIRSANSGISSIISNRGVIEQSVGALKQGYIISDIPAINTMTIYSKIGNIIVLLSMITIGLLSLASMQFTTNKRKRP